MNARLSFQNSTPLSSSRLLRNLVTKDWRLESSHGVCGVCPTGAICHLAVDVSLKTQNKRRMVLVVFGHKKGGIEVVIDV